MKDERLYLLFFTMRISHNVVFDVLKLSNMEHVPFPMLLQDATLRLVSTLSVAS